MAGVNVAAVQKLAGHQDITTTMKYVHLAEPHLQEAVDRLSTLQFTCNPQKQAIGQDGR
jgi:site-specific recombinase XerD